MKPNTDELGSRIMGVFHKSEGIYGVRRVKSVLNSQGIRVSIPTIRKKFRKYGLIPRASKKYTHFVNSVSNPCSALNILSRNFYINAQNSAWASDFTYIKTNDGFKYLTVVIDLFSRRVVGWSLSDSMSSEMVISALDKAVSERNPSHGLIVHSDRGSQYSSHIYQEFLANHNFRCSMSSPGNPCDNACAEFFFHSFKVEWIHDKKFHGISDLYSSVLQYIEVFYNRQRLHSYLGYLSPVSFENNIA